MRRFVRRSAFTLVAAISTAAAYAAWNSHGPLHSARLARPQLPAVSIVPAARASDSQAERGAFDSAHPVSAHCDLIGCPDGIAANVAEFCAGCFYSGDLLPSGLDHSSLGATILAPTSLAAFAPGFEVDSNPLYLGIEPSALAAPTPEISTAAMLTLGFAGVVWTARRTRRLRFGPDSAPSLC
jgi:hypothetical protein